MKDALKIEALNTKIETDQCHITPINHTSYENIDKSVLIMLQII